MYKIEQDDDVFSDVPTVFEASLNPHRILFQSHNVTGDLVGPMPTMEPSTPLCGINTNMIVPSSGDSPISLPLRRKRGRPRKPAPSSAPLPSIKKRSRKKPKLAPIDPLQVYQRKRRTYPTRSIRRAPLKPSSTLDETPLNDLLIVLRKGSSRRSVSSVERPSEPTIKRKRGRPRVRPLPLSKRIASSGEQDGELPPGTVSRQRISKKLADLGRKGRGGKNQPSRYGHTMEKMSSSRPQSPTSSLLHMLSAFDDVSTTDELDSAPHTKMGKVGTYAVNPSLTPTLNAIMNKHGDIAKDCQFQSSCMLTSVLENICGLVKDLQNIPFTNLRWDRLKSFYSVLEDAENVKLNVKWLRNRLDEILEAVISVKEFKNIRDAKAKKTQRMETIKKSLDLKKAELVNIQSAIQLLENQLSSEETETEKLKGTLIDLTSKCHQFHQKGLMDGLL